MELAKALQIIKREGEPRGLFLSTDLTVPGGGKTTVWSQEPADFSSDPLGLGTRRITEDGIRVLGSPCGSEAYTRKFLDEAAEKIKAITEQLPLLEDSMTSYILLRSCLGMTKVNYHLRTVNTVKHSSSLVKIDEINREAINNLVGTVLSPTSYQQAVLPVSLSGLGIRRCQDHSNCAFIASILSSTKMILELIGSEVGDAPADAPNDDDEDRAEEEVRDDEERVARALITPEVLAGLSADMGEEEEVQLNVLMAGGANQRILARKIDEHLHRQLVSSFEDSVRDQARIAGLCLPRTSDYLNCYPNRKLGIHLKSSEWCAVVKYRLGVPLSSRQENLPSMWKPRGCQS